MRLGIFLQVVDPNAIAALEQIFRDPAADATVAAGEKNVHDEWGYQKDCRLRRSDAAPQAAGAALTKDKPSEVEVKDKEHQAENQRTNPR